MINIEKPFVSLIIPMKNEERYIEKCLQSLLYQDYPASKFEILVFDGQSDDNSWSLASQFKGRIQNFSLFLNPKISQSAAWNSGIQISKGEIIGIVSAHSELAEDYISNAVETLLRTGASLVGGPTNSIAVGNLSSAIAAVLNSPFGVGGANFHYTDKEIETDTVFMGLCWKNIYYSIGGFDEDMIRNQDDEFSYRLRKNGGKIICNPKIKSKYFSRSNYLGLWNQYFQYGLYKVRVLQKHPSQMKLRQFIPILFILTIIFTFILSFVIPLGSWLLAMVVGIYVMANIFVSIFLAKKEGWNLFLFIPLAFAIIHISYGLGFLIGFFKFANRWNDKKGKIPEWENQYG